MAAAAILRITSSGVIPRLAAWRFNLIRWAWFSGIEGKKQAVIVGASGCDRGRLFSAKRSRRDANTHDVCFQDTAPPTSMTELGRKAERQNWAEIEPAAFGIHQVRSGLSYQRYSGNGIALYRPTICT